MTNETTALTPFAPQGLEQAMKLSEVLAKSSLLPGALRGKPGDVMVTLITGHELGLSPMQAIRGMHVIEGKAVMSADLTVALILRSPACEFFRLTKSTDQVAEYTTKRKGSEPVTMTWTWEQAQKAKLTGKQNWQNHPAAMLRARCAAALARAVYPDLVLGVYDPDEADEFKTASVKAPPPPPVIDVTPPPAPEPEVLPPEDEPVDDPEVKLDAEITLATTPAQLAALIPAIKALPADVQARLRPTYAARKAELTNGH